jgi:trimeric autotransporter adhesin
MTKITNDFYETKSKKTIKGLWSLFVLLLMGTQMSWGQQPIGTGQYDGGFEGTLNNPVAATQAAPNATKWGYDNANLSGSTISSTGARSGNKCLNVVSVTGNGKYLMTPALAPALAGGDGTNVGPAYTVQCYVNSATAGVLKGAIWVNAKAAGSTMANVANSWTKVTYTYTPVVTAATTNTWAGFASVVAAFTANVDDFVVYPGAVDTTAPDAPASATVTIASPTTLNVSWVAPGTGVDGGGYVVVRYAVNPNADNDPNPNGIYAINNTTTNGTGALTGTVVYVGTGLSFVDTVSNSADSYYYKIYTVDKAFNYSPEVQATAYNASLPTITPSVSSLAVFSSAVPSSSGEQSFIFSGSNLTSAVTITAPTGYLVSKTSGSGFASSVQFGDNLTPTLTNQTVYVVLSTATIGVYAGNVAITATSAITKNVSCTGNAIGKYYYKGTGSLANPSSWNTAINGSGTDYAGVFTGANENFTIMNTTAVSTDAPWAVSGSGSKIIIGDPSVAAVSLTVATTFGITGTIDLPAALSGSNTLILANAQDFPVLGTINAASTIEIQAAVAVSSASNTVFPNNFVVSTGGNATLGGTVTAYTTTFNNLTISGDGKVSVKSDVTNNNVTINGNYNSSGTGGYVSIISGPNANHILSFAGTAKTITATATGNNFAKASISVTGTYSLLSDFNFNPGTGNSRTITVTGGLDLNGNALIVDAHLATPIISVAKITANGVNSSIIFDNNSASNDQNLSGAYFVGSTVTNLDIRSTTNSGKKVSLIAGLTVSGILTVESSGILDLTTFTIGTPSSIVNNGIIKTSNTTATPLPSGFAWGGTVEYASLTGGQTIVPATSYANLKFDNTSGTNTVASGDLTISAAGSLIINSGTNLSIPGKLINNAVATSVVIQNNANLIQSDPSSVNSGAVIINRNSSSLKRLDYTLWSSPVASQNLAAFSPLTSLSPNRFYIYDSASDKYTNTVPVTLDPTITNFTPGAGYLIRMPNTDPTAGYDAGSTAISFPGVFTGVPNNGDIPFALSTAGGGFNLVGNPYPSTINLFTLQTDNSTAIGNTFYMWRKTNGVGTAYCSYVPTSAIAGTYVSNSNAQSPATFVGNIQTGQGFFVSALTTGPLVFKNGQRVTTASSFFKTKQVAADDKVWLNATNAAGDFSQMAVTYFDGATQGVDIYDGKYINDSKFALTSSINNEEYTIQGRPAFDASDVVPLNFKTDVAGDYTIAIDHAEGLLATAQDVYLVDSKTGTETNLKTDSYTFTAAAGVANARFSLKYQKTLKVDAVVFDDNSVAVYKNNGTLYVNAGAVSIANIKVYDVQGRLIAEQKDVKANTATINNLKATNQVLIVQITSDNNKVVNKKVVN